MNKVLYSSLFIVFLCISFVSASFKEASNTVLDNQVTGDFAKVTQILFKTTNLSLENVIIMYVLFIIFFFVLASLVSFVPLFHNKNISYVLAFLISVLISISGVHDLSSRELFTFIETFASGGWSIFALVICLLVMSLTGLVVWLVAGNMKKWIARENAHDSGLKLGTDVGLAKIYSGLFRKN